MYLIKDFTKIIKPLTLLIKKNQLWIWKKDQQLAFENLKKTFTTALILRTPNNEQPFRLFINASNFAISLVLF